MSSFQDQTLTCKDCGQPFIWTIAEQEFYQSRGFTNAPVRCANCRAEKKRRMGDFRRGPRQMFEITCAECGQKDTVPFQPKEDRPVLCGNCFKKQREQGAQASQGDTFTPVAEEGATNEQASQEQDIPMEQ